MKHPIRRLPTLVLPAILLAAPVAAQAPAAAAAALPPHETAPTVQALAVSEPIRIDGRLDEAAWERAAPVTELTQLTPDEGRPASERTEIRILYDADALYVGARMFDSQPPTTRLGRRDASFPSDWLTVIFDSYHDHSTAFGFEVNPSGVRRDQTRGAGGEDDSWDPVWEVATTVDGEGWTAEMRIPFSQLRFNPADAQVWGVQLERTLQRRGEFAVFSFTPSTHPGGIQRFGHLHGIAEVRTGRRLEVLPYVVARAENVDRAANPFRDDRSAGASTGVDLKYRLTSDLTLDATLNPDFGQVEVDPADVNLTAIETFFQERRPFFVEGADIFNFGAGGGNRVFYSRRIGRTPQVPLHPTVAGASDVPDAARILAAAKLSGRTAGGWSVGFMEAMTERVDARFLAPDGARESATVEPFTNYMVGRLRRDSRAGQTVVGGMMTAVNRRMDTDAARDRLHSGAYSGGVDLRHQWGQRAWTLTGFVSGSYVRGTPEALQRTQHFPWHQFQRPDASHLSLDSAATSLAGLSTEMILDYRYGRHWRFTALGGTTTPGYEIGDLGFQYRADRIDQALTVTYVEPRPGRLFRQWNVGSQVRNEVTYGRERIYTAAVVFGGAQGNNFWNYNFNVNTTFPSFDDRLTRGGPLARRPADVSVFAGVGTDPRRRVTGFVGSQVRRNVEGGGTDAYWTEVEVKPAANLSFSLEPVYERAFSRAQYLGALADARAEDTFGQRYLFSELRQESVVLNTRVNVTFTPALSLQVYAQPFIASADFGDPAELAAPRTYDFDVYGRDVGFVRPRDDGGIDIFPAGEAAGGSFAFYDPDFNVRSLRGNAVLRWEWRPGSTLYLAWQQLRNDVAPVGDFRLDRDRRALFAAQPDNVLMLKVNYWLNP